MTHPVDPRPALIKHLNALLEREYNSLPQYLLECDPYIPAEHEDRVRDELQTIADDDRRHAREIMQMIGEIEGTPLLGHYSKDIVDLSYLSIDFSLERGVAWKAAQLETYDKAIHAAEEWDTGLATRLDVIRSQEATHRKRLADLLERVRPPKKVKTPPEKPETAGEAQSSAENKA